MFAAVTHLDKIFFTKYLSSMIRSGVDLREALATIREQITKKAFRKILDDVIQRIDNGETLGDSLARYPTIFGLLFVNMIKIGEASGTLEENLRYLSTQLEKSYALRRKIKGAMMYPIIIIVAIVGLGSLLSLFVLPRLVPLFKSFNAELPWPTKVLLFITETIQKFGLLLFIGLLIVIVIAVFVSRLRQVKKFNHRLFFHVPIFGPISRNANLAHITRALGVLLKSGIPVVQALEITAAATSNIIYMEAISGVAVAVRKGGSISSYLLSNTFLFPLTVSRMIQVGEKTGNLESSLFEMAEFYEKEIDNTTNNLSSILEPILLVAIGIVVGFIVLSIIMPIYQLTESFGK